MKESEIEDLLPGELLVREIDRIERRADQAFYDAYNNDKPIVPQITNWAVHEKIDLPKDWKVRLAVEVKAKLLSSPDRYVDDEWLTRWVNMFSRFSGV